MGKRKEGVDFMIMMVSLALGCKLNAWMSSSSFWEVGVLFGTSASLSGLVISIQSAESATSTVYGKASTQRVSSGRPPRSINSGTQRE